MIEGHIYCLYNKYFDTDGAHVYKLGKCKDFNARMKDYTTYFFHKSVYKIKSEKFDDYSLAEKLLFMILKRYRMRSRREFFQCELGIIKDGFKQVEYIMRLPKKDRADEIKKIEDNSKKNKLNAGHLNDADKRKIKEVFRFEKLDQNFLSKLGCISNVDVFNQSLIYLAKSESVDEILGRDYFGKIKETALRRKFIVQKFVGLFFGSLLSEKQLKIYTKDELSDDENQFVKTHLKEIRTLFKEPRKKKPKSRVGLASWLDVVLKKYSAGFASIDKSKKMNGGDGKVGNKYYYFYKLNSIEYLELAYNRLGPTSQIDGDFLKKIDKYFSDKGSARYGHCTYSAYHKFKTFRDLHQPTSLCPC